MIGNIVVILIIMFMAGMIYRGTKRGLVRVVYSVAVLLVSVIISQILAVPIGNAIRGNEKIYNSIKEKTDSYVEVNIRPEIEKMQGDIENVKLEELSLPTAITKAVLQDNIEKEMSKGTDAVCEVVSTAMVLMCLRAMVSLVIFILVFIAMRALGIFFDIFSRLPGIRYINKGIGGCIGFLQALLVLWILCLVLMAMTGTEFGNKANKVVSENQILSFIYDTNPIVGLYHT